MSKIKYALKNKDFFLSLFSFNIENGKLLHGVHWSDDSDYAQLFDYENIGKIQQIVETVTGENLSMVLIQEIENENN